VGGVRVAREAGEASGIPVEAGRVDDAERVVGVRPVDDAERGALVGAFAVPVGLVVVEVRVVVEVWVVVAVVPVSRLAAASRSSARMSVLGSPAFGERRVGPLPLVEVFREVAGVGRRAAGSVMACRPRM